MSGIKWKLESDVNDWVKAQFARLKLEKLKDYNEESGMSDFMRAALKGSAKTESKVNFGKPDFHIEKYKVPVVIEDKLGINKLVSETKNGIKVDDKSIRDYAVNGALNYARHMIASNKYDEVIAIGIAGDDSTNVTVQVYYVFGSAENTIKKLNVNTLDFLENESTFEAVYQDAVLSEAEKHKILIDSQQLLQVYAKKLNKLMHNHNITAPQRVLYVSGMLLAMQDSILSNSGALLLRGLTPVDLEGIQDEEHRDGVKIVGHIKTFLRSRGIERNKKELMLASFNEIRKDPQRDELVDCDKAVSQLIKGQASINKQIFVFIYEYIYKSIDALGGHIDIMGEMYSEFLKYALGDGKEIGIVLTPPYVTKMMAQILNVNQESKVMDLATGSAGFLISSMELMIDDANSKYGKNTSKANELIKEIKQSQLLGVELNAEMFTLATTNMILRGDGSSRIEKGDAFNRPDWLYTDFKADRLLLNPPFSFVDNGLPFLAYGLDKMERGGLGAIIIQDSIGSGKAVKLCKEILSKHTMLASIKMPIDLFIPMAGVQTSVYIFQAHKKHDFENTVKFIDFRNDGYKRAKRGIVEVSCPIQRYQDIIKIYKAGKLAKSKINKEIWNLDEIYVEDFISENGNDWNFEHHQSIDTKPTLKDFQSTVTEYLNWDINQVLNDNHNNLQKKDLKDRLEKLEKQFISSGGNWLEFRLGDLFEKKTMLGVPKYAENLIENNDGYHIFGQNISYQYPQKVLLDEKYLHKVDENYPILAYTSSAAEIGMIKESFYRTGDNGAFQGLIPKEKYNRYHILYFLTLLERYFSNFGYSTSMANIIDLNIELPVINNSIALDFMESYIKIFELGCMECLEEYFVTNGLNSHSLLKELM